MITYFAIDSNDISWPIGPCYSNEDAANQARSMGIDVVDIYSRVVDEEESNND